MFNARQQLNTTKFQQQKDQRLRLPTRLVWSIGFQVDPLARSISLLSWLNGVLITWQWPQSRLLSVTVESYKWKRDPITQIYQFYNEKHFLRPKILNKHRFVITGHFCFKLTFGKENFSLHKMIKVRNPLNCIRS